ncbi:MBL fold metallo-hydrolase [Hyunsoonleella ulvae]|uniref:MBL fold metallo-hydrolase n=1 Tax=Hyunsoonleella ulvae TaxID=2799948 RepID=UPI001939A47B|nr:MBL fold metallo-hydrolase [Hyunsoonleella ulvae]
MTYAKTLYLLFFTTILFSCEQNKASAKATTKDTFLKETHVNKTSIVILGTTQDAGAPQIGCKKTCCANLFNNVKNKNHVVSLGLLDAENNKAYLFEATPDIGAQTKILDELKIKNTPSLIDGIFITHAHIGHYTGLMFLGKEAMNSQKTPTYVMPKMKTFLEENGPWSQVVKNKNIVLHSIEHQKPVKLSSTIEVTPFLVPHRDEFSETVGYKIKGPNKTALFIPDIDKWEKWNQNIVEEIKKVDYAFLDATFFNAEEINNRDISQIPHPFVIESLKKFERLDSQEKNKIVFIHFNHTNPLLRTESNESNLVLKEGFKIARQLDVYEL